MVEFDPEQHAYTVKGFRVPSVTQVINQYQKVTICGGAYMVDVFTGATFDASLFERAGNAGTALHKGTELLLTGETLDWSALAPQLVAPLENFAAFLEDFPMKPLMIETPMYSQKWGYAGTVDWIVEMFGKRWLIDLKTGIVSKMAGVQTSAYEKLFRENTGWTGQLKRAVLHLPKDGGKVKLIEQGNPDDWEFFKARLTTYNFLNGRISG